MEMEQDSTFTEDSRDEVLDTLMADLEDAVVVEETGDLGDFDDDED